MPLKTIDSTPLWEDVEKHDTTPMIFLKKMMKNGGWAGGEGARVARDTYPSISERRRDFRETTRYQGEDEISERRRDSRETTRFQRDDDIPERRRDFREKTTFQRNDEISERRRAFRDDEISAKIRDFRDKKRLARDDTREVD